MCHGCDFFYSFSISTPLATLVSAVTVTARAKVTSCVRSLNYNFCLMKAISVRYSMKINVETRSLPFDDEQQQRQRLIAERQVHNDCSSFN
jgi:hypothetical protein